MRKKLKLDSLGSSYDEAFIPAENFYEFDETWMPFCTPNSQIVEMIKEK